jgi:uncharacterized protein YfaS (alpha-2-macroglobulin family)
VYFNFSQSVTVPAGNTFQLSLDITNLTGQAETVNFGATLGALTPTAYTPASGFVFDGHNNYLAGEVSGTGGTIGATFAVNSTAPQTMILTIQTVVPAISTGQSGCLEGFLQSFTLANATLVKVN